MNTEPKISNQIQPVTINVNSGSYPIGGRSQESIDFKNKVVNIIIEIAEGNNPEEFTIGIVHGLPTSGAAADNIYASSFKRDFNVMGSIPYSLEILNKGISIIDKYVKIYREDGNLNIEEIARRMRQIMDFMEKEEEKEGRKVNFPEIKKLLLVSENFEDHYDPSEIVNSMRTGQIHRSSNSSSTLTIKGKEIKLSQEELRKLNELIFPTNNLKNYFKGLVEKVLIGIGVK